MKVLGTAHPQHVSNHLNFYSRLDHGKPIKHTVAKNVRNFANFIHNETSRIGSLCKASQ